MTKQQIVTIVMCGMLRVNVFHYYINKNEKICKVKHVQGIMLAHLNQINDAQLFKKIKHKVQNNYMQWIKYIFEGTIMSMNEKEKGYHYTEKYNKGGI